jgi:hypothetical protein
MISSICAALTGAATLRQSATAKPARASMLDKQHLIIDPLSIVLMVLTQNRSL